MIKKFISYYKNHMVLFILDMFAALLIAGLDLLFPAVTRKLIDDYIPDKNMRMMLTVASILLALYLFKVILQVIVNYWGHIMGTRIEYDMRNDLFKKIETLNFSYFDDNKTGMIMNRLVADIRDVGEMAHHVPEDIFISIIMLIGSLTILFTYDYRLFLVALTYVVILIVFSIIRRKAMLNGFRKVRVEHAEINSQIESSIGGIRLSQSFTNELYEYDKFNKNNAKYRDSWSGAYKAMTIFITGNDFIINLFNLSFLLIGGYLLYTGNILDGILIASILYINNTIQPIRRLMNSIQQIQTGLAGIERFYEIMNMEPVIQNPLNPVILKDPKGVIEFKNVSFKYTNHEKYVIKNFNLSIQKGESIGLVGETGVGKSTISQLIPRFYDVTEGEILVDGINIKNYDLNTLRKAIGHVQQDVYIFYGTIKENIMYGNPSATMEEVIEAAKKARIHEFIISLEKGYDTITGERGVKLSGGQKQRISIARVFLKNPPILILDEATSSLDTITERKIQEALEELSLERTCIIIAHRLSTLKNVNEIIVLDDKGISERGTHQKLVSRNGYYADLYKAIS
ncbi:ABC transporter ATP-binding protein [Mycoplasmatota bacterium]|nr:ABC transporter ATP-binding protein [Mycoplasmatota bacterium]